MSHAPPRMHLRLERMLPSSSSLSTAATPLPSRLKRIPSSESRVCAEAPSFTQVPKAKTEEEAITGALALAHDCQSAYGEAAKKAEDADLKKNLEKFASQASSQIDQWRGELLAMLAGCMLQQAPTI